MTLLMAQRSRVWLVLVVLFLLVNVAGGAFAVWQGEWVHACVHAVLALLAEYFVLRLTSRPVEDY